jgi:hypothetical protein
MLLEGMALHCLKDRIATGRNRATKTVVILIQGTLHMTGVQSICFGGSQQKVDVLINATGRTRSTDGVKS